MNPEYHHNDTGQDFYDNMFWEDSDAEYDYDENAELDTADREAHNE